MNSSNPDDLALLDSSDVVTAYRLIEELCERGNDPQAWRRHFTVRLSEIFDAVVAISFLVRFSLDPADVQPKTLSYVIHGENEVWRRYLERGDVRDNPKTPHIMERYGTDFTAARSEWVDDETWRSSSFYRDVALPSGWDDAMNSQVGITRPGVVDGIGIARALGAAPISPRDVSRLRFIHQELARLWRKHDPLDVHMLPPRQRETLEGIRRGQSRKEIAEAMAVSEHTVHTYEKALFERAGVGSRAELQAVTAKIFRPVLMP